MILTTEVACINLDSSSYNRYTTKGGNYPIIESFDSDLQLVRGSEVC